MSILKSKSGSGSSQIKTLIDKGVLEEQYQDEHRLLIKQQQDVLGNKTLSDAQHIVFR